MQVNVDVDQLFSLNNYDPKKTAKQIEQMRQEGLKLNLRVRSPHTAEVFTYLGGSRHPWRFLLQWLMKPQGIFASIGVITYGVLAILMF